MSETFEALYPGSHESITWPAIVSLSSMGESFVKDLLSMCLERISMEQDVSNSELGTS